MNRVKKFWNKYREIIAHNCTDDLIADTSLIYWQNKLFAASIIYLIPFSIIAVLPGMYVAYKSSLLGLIAVDSLAVIIVFIVAFVPGISVFLRKILFNAVLYAVSTALLFYLGSFGPGLLYLLAITIFILLTLDTFYGYIALALNTLICIIIGLLIYFSSGEILILHEYALDTWIAVSVNLIFLSATAVVLIPILFKGLQSAIIEENNLRSTLEIEQKKLQSSIFQLKDKNEELQHFAYSVSHDLKEPLRMIQSFMELLNKKYADQLDEKARKYIYFATDGAKRMSISIDDLLEYSRVGRLYTNTELIQSYDMVQEVLQILEGEIESKDAKIDIGKLPEINAVPVTFRMLMQNLISNALKYQETGKRPEIQINAHETKHHWEFSIKDNGIGIDPEYHDEIFSLFRRLHTKDTYQGSGIGLAICKKIVEQHGGRIWTESEENKGSIFYFTISKNNQ